MKKRIALIGNPNSGKTSLFNVITGLNAKTGNFAGVTIESKVGYYKKDKEKEFIDLPGLYDLTANSKDETVVLEYLKENKISAIVNVVDGLNLERNLYLTLKLCALQIPLIIAVNFYDQLQKQKIEINAKRLESVFNVKVVCVSALKNINVDKLVSTALEWDKPPINLSQKYKEADSVYNFINNLSLEVVNAKKIKQNKVQIFLDKLFFNKFLALPIFILFLSVAFYLTNLVGSFFESGVNALYLVTFGKVVNCGVVLDLLINGVIKGVFSVASFLPHVLMLFFFLSLMEDSGYMSRVAFMLDGLLKSFNISGKSVIPFVLCSGCTVNGVMSSRIIEDDKERKKCISLCPFIPCGAKSAVILYFANKFFGGNPLVSVSVYVLGVISIILFSKLSKNSKSCACSFIMEIPPLRVPTFKKVMAVTTEKLKDFFLRVAPIIILSSIIMSLFMRFGLQGFVGDDIEKSFLYFIGKYTSYLFIPLGFGNWQASVALISGIVAKEGVIGALEIVGVDNLFSSIFSAYSFLCLIVFSPPCIASLITMKRELKDKKNFYTAIIMQMVVAYLSAMTINFIGEIFICKKHLHFIILIGIMLLSLTIYFVIKSFVKRRASV